MVVVMAEGASEEQIQNVVAHLVEQGFDVHRSTGAAAHRARRGRRRDAIVIRGCSRSSTG